MIMTSSYDVLLFIEVLRRSRPFPNCKIVVADAMLGFTFVVSRLLNIVFASVASACAVW